MLRFQPNPDAFALCTVGLVAGLTLYLSGWDIEVRAVLRLYTALPGDIWQIITELGHGGVQLAICLGGAGVEYLRGEKFRTKIWLWTIPVFLLAGLINQIIKRILARPRPKMYPELYDPQWWEHTAHLNSFPSGHTLTSFAIVAFLLPLYPRARIPLLLLATLAGVSRIMVGAHWPGDVVVGGFLGYAIGMSVLYNHISSETTP